MPIKIPSPKTTIRKTIVSGILFSEISLSSMLPAVGVVPNPEYPIRFSSIAPITFPVPKSCMFFLDIVVSPSVICMS